jgi:hypothetical protein
MITRSKFDERGEEPMLSVGVGQKQGNSGSVESPLHGRADTSCAKLCHQQQVVE